MRDPQLQKIKIKRILFYYQELSRHKIRHDACMEFMSYVFHVGELWLTRIINDNSIEDLAGVSLPFKELDIKFIDNYAKSLHKKASEERNKQPDLFSKH